MTTEQRGEIPSGYIWRECTGIDARFPMPDTWFFLTQRQADTRAYFMTRESIASQGSFVSGLSINVMPKIKEKTGRSALDLAKGMMQSLPLVATSSITKIEDGPLVIYRRFFVMPTTQRMPVPQYKGGIEVKSMQPTQFYVETAGNKNTDTVYIIQFESPSSKWKEDRQIARTMIENGVLDKNI